MASCARLVTAPACADRQSARRLNNLPHLRGDAFDLPQMIQIVPRHGFDQRLERHRAALGMRQRFRQRSSRNRPDQCNIPLAHGSKYINRGARLQSVIGGGPPVLIERLDYVMRLRQRLAQAEREGQLSIRQVTKYFASAPLAWSKRSLRALGPEGFQQRAKLSGCLRNHAQRIPIS
jgi:hypothetical protein